jgi:hypothetical protein
VEKHVNTIFSKVGLVEEDHADRRVHALLKFRSEVG